MTLDYQSKHEIREGLKSLLKKEYATNEFCNELINSYMDAALDVQRKELRGNRHTGRVQIVVPDEFLKDVNYNAIEFEIGEDNGLN